MQDLVAPDGTLISLFDILEHTFVTFTTRYECPKERCFGSFRKERFWFSIIYFGHFTAIAVESVRVQGNPKKIP